MIHDLNYGLKPGRKDWRITVLWTDMRTDIVHFYLSKGGLQDVETQIIAKAKVEFSSQRDYKWFILTDPIFFLKFPFFSFQTL